MLARALCQWVSERPPGHSAALDEPPACSAADHERPEDRVEALPAGGGRGEAAARQPEPAVGDQPCQRLRIENLLERPAGDRFQAGKVDALGEAQAHDQHLFELLPGRERRPHALT